jgi:hypothetical protein
MGSEESIAVCAANLNDENPALITAACSGVSNCSKAV